MKSRLLTLSSIILLILLIGLTACSTPESRIRKNPELFKSFPAEVQEKIRAGEVDIGFTPAMVEIAVDRPDRKYRRSSVTGEVEVWSYVDTQLSYDQQLVSGTFNVKDSEGRTRTVHDNVWVTVQNKTEFEVLRIEFDGSGKVVAVERSEQ